MGIVNRVCALIQYVFGRARVERDMDDEFNSHIQHRADDLERGGLSRDAAERAARVEFGGVEAQKEGARDARGLRLWEEMRSNVVFAMRGLRRHPIQSLIVVTTLTLGIGTSAVVFSVASALAFRARVDHDAATFTRILVSYRTDTTGPSFPDAAVLGDYLAYARQLRSLSRITGWQHVQVSLSGGARPTPGDLVTCEFFEVYGPLRPTAGRLLQRNDCDSSAPVAVIGNELWHTVFGADTSAVGRLLRINGETVRIVGVAPSFTSASNDDQLWLPYTLRESLHLGPNDPASPKAMQLHIDGRLAPAATRSDVATEARVIAAQQDRLTPGRLSTLFVTDGSLIAKPGNGVAVTGILAMVFVGLACLALVACASVVSILQSIAHTRRTEMALRMALGAGTTRLAAMLGTELLILAGVAGAAASVLTFPLPRLLLEWIIQRPVGFSLAPDWHVFVFLFGTTLAAAIVSANAPMRSVLALDLNSTLRRLPDLAASRKRGNLLMSAEIGGAAALLVATIALTRLPARISNAPPRFDARHVLAMNLRAPVPATGGWQSFHDDLARTLVAVSGVRGVTFATSEPVGDEGTGLMEVTTAGNHRRTVPWTEVSPTYFDVFGLRIERGRSFALADADCAAPVCPVVVSREGARELWGSTDPLGQRLTVDPTHALIVVGIAADATSEIAEPAQASMMYTPWRPNARLYQPFLKVDDASGGGVVRRVSSAVSERFAGAVSAPKTVQEQLTLLTDAFQRIGEVVGLTAVITSMLAIVGVYGVIALAARRRLKEMGIRLALGARRRDVYRAMVEPNARSVALGLVVGALFATLLAVGSDRFLAQVFPVRIVDPIAFVLAASALAAAVTIAMLVPARRATAVDPALVLREE
jgi:predicted permease